MPYDTVTNNWIERELRLAFWHVWLELFVQVNPVAHNASKVLDAWLGFEGIVGGLVSDQVALYIGADIFSTVQS
jgi:hypothetical protein